MSVAIAPEYVWTLACSFLMFGDSFKSYFAADMPMNFDRFQNRSFDRIKFMFINSCVFPLFPLQNGVCKYKIVLCISSFIVETDSAITEVAKKMASSFVLVGCFS